MLHYVLNLSRFAKINTLYFHKLNECNGIFKISAKTKTLTSIQPIPICICFGYCSRWYFTI